MKGSLTGHSLEVLSSKKHFELLYNMGVTLLHCNQPLPAFDCLLNVVQAYPFNPRLWLRLAECCTQVYKQVSSFVCLNPLQDDFIVLNHNFISRRVTRIAMRKNEDLSLSALLSTERWCWVLAFNVRELSES